MPRTAERCIRAAGLVALVLASACGSAVPAAAGHPADPRTEEAPRGAPLSSLAPEEGRSVEAAPDMAGMPGMHHGTEADGGAR